MKDDSKDIRSEIELLKRLDIFVAERVIKNCSKKK